MAWHRYPALKYLIFAILGIVLYSYFPPNHAYLPYFISVFSIILVMSFILKNPLFRFLLLFAFLIGGYLSAFYNDDKNDSTHFSKQMDFEKYIAQINSATETKAKTYKVKATVLAIFKDKKWLKTSGTTLLYFNHSAGVFPKYGEYYVLRNSIREIEAPKNPFEFDYKTFQARKNIFTHQFIRDGDFLKVGSASPNIFMQLARQANDFTHNVFAKHLPEAQQLSVADALISGQQSNIDNETKQSYTKTGSIHALAVSGMHVAILFTLLNFIFIKTLRLNKNAAFIIIISLLSVYAVYTGLTPSVCRATVMFIILQYGVLKGREGEAVNTLLVSALLLLLFIPNWLYDVGFQLSYLAVLGILILHPRILLLFSTSNKIISYFWEVTSVSLAAQVFTLPLTLYYFHQFPNYFLIANPVVSILSSVLLPLGLFLVPLSEVPYLGDFMGYIFKVLIDLLNASVAYIADWPGAVTTGFDLSIWIMILLFLGIYLLMVFLKKKQAWSLISLFSLLIFIAAYNTWKDYTHNSQREITFHFIPKAWGISIIEGRNATFISSDSLCKEPLIFQYHLKNYYDAKAIQHVDFQAADKSALIKYKDLKINRVCTPADLQNNIEADYVLFANKSIPKNLKSFNPKTKYILDGSYSKWGIEKLFADDMNLAKKYIVLYEKGSQTFPLK
jgi:competence protein ComEC